MVPTYIVCVIGNTSDSYWTITHSQYMDVMEAKDHQDRIDSIVSGEQASISSTYDVDLTFDNCDEDQWEECFKEEWESYNE